MSKQLDVTNKTIINRCAKLTTNGFLIPNIVKERVRSYSLSEFAKANNKKLFQKLMVLCKIANYTFAFLFYIVTIAL